MEKEKEISTIPEGKISNIEEFGNSTNKIIVETVGSFRNLMNFTGKPKEKRRYLTEKYIDASGAEKEREIVEAEAIYYPFEETPQFELVKAQTVKLILESKEVDITVNNLIKFFDREPLSFRKIIAKILESFESRNFQEL